MMKYLFKDLMQNVDYLTSFTDFSGDIQKKKKALKKSFENDQSTGNFQSFFFFSFFLFFFFSLNLKKKSRKSTIQ